MKKYLTSAIVLLLLLSAFPSFAAAEGGLKVVMNGKPAAFGGASPYVSAGTVYLPIRAAAASLGIKVAFEKASNEIRLTAQGTRVTFKAGAAKASLNGVEKSFGKASSIRNGRVYVPLTFFHDVLGYETAFDAGKKEVSVAVAAAPEPFDPQQLARQVIQLLSSEQHQQLFDQYFDKQLQEAVSVSQLSKTWNEVGKAAGKYAGVESIQTESPDANTTVVTAVLKFEKLDMTLTTVIGSDHKLAGILLQHVPAEEPTPTGLTEEQVVVGKDTAYPLSGTLTIPKNASGPVPAVVLVQGSGPSDRDETAGGYKPFRDIAWGLAQQGIAVLRYEKRTYAYGKTFTPESLAKFTVKDETVDDAIAASKLLKSDSRIDSSRVYLIGHSLGGMLAPRIDAEGGNFAGIVVLAGSPRTLWEIINDQNSYFIRAMKDEDPAKSTNEAMSKAEYEKAKKIASMTDQEAMAASVFGLPAFYFKEMDSHGAASYAAKLTKPILVLQGEDDFQIFADKDYVQWQKLFEGKTNASFKLYPGLNHFFVDYSGEAEGTLDEYSYPGTVSADVIRDIAVWIMKR